MNRYVLTGRIFDGKRLIGVKITEIESLKSKFIPKSKLDRFFRDYHVINCIYRYGSLSLTDSKLNIKKFPRYNKNLRLVKSTNKVMYYTESQVIASITGGNIDKVTYCICGALVSGAITDPYSEPAKQHAELYYNEIRAMTTDVYKIAMNTGIAISEIERIKRYLFLDEHKLITGVKRFDPSFEIAQSWQRLMSAGGKDIKPHDITLIKHELYEEALVKSGMDQDKAHIETSKKYNYTKESQEYYKNLSLRR